MEKIQGKVYGKSIELEKALSLPDGAPVLLSIEPLPISDEERGKQILDLCGAWKNDSSLTAIFERIAQERRAHKEREVRI